MVNTENKSRGIRKSLPGNIYQVKLFMLYMLRCINNNYVFNLTSEEEYADKLDDIILAYKKPEQRVPTFRFVQAKHKKNEKNKIGYKALVDDNQGNFSVVKYFTTYRNIKKKIKSETKEYVIYTNMGFHQNTEDILEEVNESDPFTDVPTEFMKKCPKYYKLKINKNHHLYSLLKSTTESKALAKELAKLINNNKKITLTGLIKTYHRWLIENVIDLRTNTLKSDMEDTLFTQNLLELVNERNVVINLSRNFVKEIDRNGPNLIENAVNDEEIMDFLNNFVFAVNQPNEVMLGELIGKEMGEKFNVLQGDAVANEFFMEILNWFKNTDSKAYTKNSGKALFRRIKSKIKNLMYSKMDVLFTEELKACSVKFKNKNDQLNAFLNDETKLSNLLCADTFLGSLEVYDNIQSGSKYKVKDSKIYMDMDAMIRVPSAIKKIEKHFTRDFCNLLIVKCRPCAIEDLHLIEDLLKILENTKSKKIILISTQSMRDLDWPYELLVLGSMIVLNSTNIKFSDFAPATQNRLKNTCVNFQGTDKPLSKVVEESYLAGISGNLLLPLIRNNKMDIGKQIKHADKVIYISRQFNQRIEIETGILIENTNIPEAIVITGDENTSDLEIKNSAVKFIHNTEWDNHTFESTSEPTHWLKLQDNTLKWHRSNCSIKHLVNFRTETTSPKDKEQLLKEKFCIISDIAGMGKSTVLTHIGNQIQKSDKNVWVVRVDLISDPCQIYFNKNIDRHFDNNMIKGFLIDTLLNIETNPSLERDLLNSILNGEKTGIHISLLIDGFDEICPAYEKLVIQFLQELQQLNIANIFVTTRPLLKNTLEYHLGVFSYTLEPFPARCQREYLLKFFETKLCRDVNDRMEKYVNCLINNITYSYNEKEMQFMGVPLHIFMVAQIFAKTNPKEFEWETCEEFVMSNNSQDPRLPNSLGFIKLYDLFYQHKEYVFVFNKAKENLSNNITTSCLKDLVNNLLEYQKKLSLKLFFSEQEIKDLDGQTKTISENLQSNLPKFGFVVIPGNDQKIPEFTHRTYAEYFAAKFIIELLNASNDKIKHILFTKVLLNTEFKVIRAFLNSNITSGYLDINNDESYLVQLWKKDPHLVCINSQSILQVAAEDGNINLIEFILNNLRDHERVKEALIQYENEEGQTALYSAVKSGSLETVKRLYDYYTNLYNKDKCGRSILFIATFHGHWNVVKWLLEKDPDVGNEDINVRRVFRYACNMGKLDVMQWFFHEGIFDQIYMKRNGVLLEVIKYGRLDVIEWLLQNQYYCIDTEDDYENLLYAAFEHRKPDIVTYLSNIYKRTFYRTFKYIEAEFKQPSLLTKKRKI